MTCTESSPWRTSCGSRSWRDSSCNIWLGIFWKREKRLVVEIKRTKLRKQAYKQSIEEFLPTLDLLVDLSADIALPKNHVLCTANLR